MKRRIQFLAGSVLVTLLAMVISGCFTDSDEPSFSNPFDPALGEDLPVPESVTITVGDNMASLSWELPGDETAEEYAIFRRRLGLDGEIDERLIDQVSVREYTDNTVRNGHFYAYQIAAGVGGQFGGRTEEILVEPGLFTFAINNDSEYTNTREVTVRYLTAKVEAIRFSENAETFTGSWQTATGTSLWTLSPGDTLKTLYAQFRLEDGSESVPVSDSITLDTRAAIESVAFDGETTRSPGDTIHFTIVTGEANGTAVVNVSNVFSTVPLFDDGTNGDTEANDGIYERDLIIPAATAVSQKEVYGGFIDFAGNSATGITAPRLLTVQKSPAAIVLLDPLVSEPPDSPAVTIRWELSQEEEFNAYRVFRSETTPVTVSDRLVTTHTSQSSVEYIDHDVCEGLTYYYRVYVQNDFGMETGSNTIEVLVENLRPPEAVTVRNPSASSSSQIALEWGSSDDLDFKWYRVYRNQTGAVSDADLLIAEIGDVNLVYFDDSELTENTVYYYRVYVVDQGGLVTRSNEVDERTENEAPAAVNLKTPNATSTTRIALEWGISTAVDFSSYQIYRNETGAVSEDDFLVAEITNINTIFLDDSALTENTEYFYRVYTIDQSELSARSNEVSAQTQNEAPPAVTMNEGSGITSTRVTLSWTESTIHDFAKYILYRDEISTVTTSSTKVVEMDDLTFISFQDTELESSTRYYYRVFVIDDARESEATGSNTISIETATSP